MERPSIGLKIQIMKKFIAPPGKRSIGTGSFFQSFFHRQNMAISVDWESLFTRSGHKGKLCRDRFVFLIAGKFIRFEIFSASEEIEEL